MLKVKVRNNRRFVKYNQKWFGTPYAVCNFEYSKRNPMQYCPITLPSSHYMMLERIMTALLRKHDTQYIICFGWIAQCKIATHYFAKSCERNFTLDLQWVLLMRTSYLIIIENCWKRLKSLACNGSCCTGAEDVNLKHLNADFKILTPYAV